MKENFMQKIAIVTIVKVKLPGLFQNILGGRVKLER